MTRLTSEIAADIRANWKNVYYGAVPYLEAMESGEMEDIGGMYREDRAVDVVIYFLSNAQYWRGVEAKRIKAELNIMVENV